MNNSKSMNYDDVSVKSVTNVSGNTHEEDIIGPSKEVKELISKLCPESVKKIRKFVKDFDPKDDKYTDTLEAQVYVVASKSKTGSQVAIARNLGMSLKEFYYYRDTYPQFAAALRMGIMDAKNNSIEQLTKSIYDKAIGAKISESKTTEVETREYGEQVFYNRQTVTIDKQLPPDANAAIELLKRYAPEIWDKPKTLNVNVQSSFNMDVTEDVTIDVNLAELSPSALRELLNASPVPTNNTELAKREDGVSVNMLKEPIKKQNERKKLAKQGIIVEGQKRGRGAPWTPERRAKYLATRKKTEELKRKLKELNPEYEKTMKKPGGRKKKPEDVK